MSLDPSLKSKGKLTGTRSVFTRAERIAKLKEERKFKKEDGALGLRKTRTF